MEKLGIEPIQLLLQAVNFIVVAVVLTKFLYKPILRTLNERKKKIAEGLAFTDKMKLEEEKTEKKRQEILAKAHEDGKKIIEESKDESKKVGSEIIEKAHKEAGSIIENTKKEIEIERQEMERSLRDKTVDIAESIVTRILSESLTEQSQKKIIEKRLQAISKEVK